MLLSLNRVTAGRNLSWREFVALAGRTGYDAVDVDLDAVQRDGVPAALEAFEKNKVKPGVCGLPTEFRKDEAAFRDSLKELDGQARLAVQVGCPRMVTWVPPTYEAPGSEMRKILRRRWTEMGKIAATHGVRLGFEFITPLHFRATVPADRVCVWNMKGMLELCRECGDNVGLLLDSWHWHHDPEHSVQGIVEAGRARIVHVHLNDSADLPPAYVRDNQRLLPGEGVIDLRSFLRALQQIGYSDPASIEVFGRLDNLPPDEAARRALRATRALLARREQPDAAAGPDTHLCR